MPLIYHFYPKTARKKREKGGVSIVTPAVASKKYWRYAILSGIIILR